MEQMGFCCRCCGVMVANGRLNPPSPIICNPSPPRCPASTPPNSFCECCPAHSCPWVWIAACTHSPSAGVEGKLGYGPLSPLSEAIVSPRNIGTGWGQFLCIRSTVLICEGLPTLRLGGKKTQVCLPPHVTCLHIFPPFLSLSYFFASPQKKKKNPN